MIDQRHILHSGPLALVEMSVKLQVFWAKIVCDKGNKIAVIRHEGKRRFVFLGSETGAKHD